MIESPIRYMRSEADTNVVSDDGESRRNNRDATTAIHKMSILTSAERGKTPANAREVLDRQGFCCVDWKSSVADELLSVQNPQVYRVEKSPETEDSRRVREKYIEEAEQMLKEATGAKDVFTLHHACRYGKPNPKGVEYLTAYATFAHTDYTESIVPNAGPMLLRRGVPEAELADLDVAFYNLWQPVLNEVEQHPLALLHPSTLDLDDIRSVSLGYKVAPKSSADKKALSADIHNKADESKQQAPDVGQLVHNDRHQWHYWPKMTPNEILVFVQFDTRDRHKQVFHTAFFDETAPKDFKRRQSIELHAVCTFPKKKPASKL